MYPFAPSLSRVLQKHLRLPLNGTTGLKLNADHTLHDSLSLHVRRTRLLGEHLLAVARVHRVPPALALSCCLLQRVAVGSLLSEQNINFLESTAGRLGTVVPDVGSSEETADQRPDEDLGTDGIDASASTENHDPGREPFACGAQAAGNVAVAEGSNFGA